MTRLNSPPVLSVRKLTVSFGDRTVIHDLSFDVTCGETSAIIGPNGAGKTVLLRALLNQLPHEGAIAWSPETKLGYVPQAIAADRQLPLLVSDLLGAKAHLLVSACGLCWCSTVTEFSRAIPSLSN